MKRIYKITSLILVAGLASCNDFLDREPLSDVSPNQYFNNETDLSAYTISRYSFPTHSGWNIGTFADDNHTDNQATSTPSGIWRKGEWRVPANNSGNDNSGDFSFDRIRQINYFLEQTESKAANGSITGTPTNIDHYIGEAYFLRAYEYFKKLKSIGDFPIIKEVLPDDKNVLIEASKRQPRNQVARFILEDLDKAIGLLKNSPVENKNRISKQVAQLFRSRVALFEATWLKYHKGTARVPGGPGWGGNAVNYPLGGIDQEVDFFLNEAMTSAKQVIDFVPLTESNHNISGQSFFENPYFKMFYAEDMSSFSDILLWRSYNSTFVSHHTMHYLPRGGNSGYTRGFVDTFVMKNGLPIYDAGSGYQGDATLIDVKTNRDERLQLFTRATGDYITFLTNVVTATYPDILEQPESRSVTGYEVTKGLHPDSKYTIGENGSTMGSAVFRVTEAYLNYIEASYLKNNSLDATALTCWKKIRSRAGLPEDPQITITATDLSKENDWAVYSAGSQVDATLYNIRRERRCEFIAEGMRYDDLRRWRALDQVQNYQIEGFNLWASMYNEDFYKTNAGVSKLIELPADKPNVSSRTLSTYLRPYQIVQANNQYYNGYTWTKAHYLSPIAYENFLLTSYDKNPATSVIYQNPDWPVTAGGVPNE